MITSWVGPKQYLALRVKAAFAGYKARVEQASIVERAVPSASLSPFAPGDVIAVLAVGISGFPGRTKDTLGWTRDCVPGARGSCQNSKDRGGANQSEFRHSFLPLIPLSQNNEYG